MQPIAMIVPITKQLATEAKISFVSVSFASFSFPAPKSCPTIIASALPIAINTTLNKFVIVEEILIPATAASPLVE